MPQAPQFCGWVSRFTQTPLHSSKPIGQEHWPLTHIVPPVHLTPQLPQLSGSEFSITQEPPQLVAPSHMALHVPALQTWSAAHRLPHVPQLSGSLRVSVQTPAQLVSVGAQPHLPWVQSWPEAQV